MTKMSTKIIKKKPKVDCKIQRAPNDPVQAKRPKKVQTQSYESPTEVVKSYDTNIYDTAQLPCNISRNSTLHNDQIVTKKQNSIINTNRPSIPMLESR